MKVVKISLLSEEKKKKMKITDRIKRKKDYSGYIDGLILVLVILSSFNAIVSLEYIVIPIFLTVVFILLQFKRLVTKKVEMKNK